MSEKHIVDPIEKEKAWEDLGRPEEPAQNSALFAFTVYMDNEGAIRTEVFDSSEMVCRRATTFEIYSTCRDIVSDIESQMLANRVSKIVLEQLKESDPKTEVRDRLISALERHRNT